MSAPDVPESSPVRQDVDAEADAEPEQPQHRWVALVSKPIIFADNDDDDRVRAMAPAADIYLDLRAPPLPSYLVLHPDRIGDFANKPTAYILAASDDWGRLLFRVTNPDPGVGEPAEDEFMYLCSTGRTRTATPLPGVPYAELNVEAQPRRSVGLIVDRDYGPGNYLVVQLSPRPPDSVLLGVGDKLLCYSTAETGWFVKPLITTDAVRMRKLCGENGVVAHGGRLYWLALAYGIFVCDPCAETSRMRFIPLPGDCETWAEEELSRTNRVYVKQRRRVVPSDGHLRYVEIRGLPYDGAPDVPPAAVNPISVRMHTLVDTEVDGEEPQWRLEYEVHFAEVWAHGSYDAAGLKREDVPHVTLVDPDDHRVVYFLQNSKLFGLDERTKGVVSCEACQVRDDRDIMLQNSRPIIDAWKQSPPPPPSPRAESLRDAAQTWYALISYPVLIVCKGKGGARQKRIRMDLQVPPIISYMEMQLRRTAPVRPVGYFAQEELEPSAYILATDCSGRLLVKVADPVTNRTTAPDLYICDAHVCSASTLPPIPLSALAVPEQPRHMALIANPLLRGEFVVAQFHPGTSPVLTDRLLLYSSASRQWSVKTLHLDDLFTDRMRRLCAEALVIAHNKWICWLALGYGIFVCELFTPRPSLQLIALPDGCEIREELAHRVAVNQSSCVAPSEGKLRYVEIRGLSDDLEVQGDADPDAAHPPHNPTVWMWTLVDMEPKADKRWRFEYQVTFAEIWNSDTYKAAKLPHRVPHVALVDPNNHFVIYFFQGAKIFGFHLRAMEVISCEDGVGEDVRERECMLQRSRPILSSWQLSLRRPDDEGGSPTHIIRETHANPYERSIAENVQAVQELPPLPSTSQTSSADKARNNIQLKLRHERRPATKAKLVREKSFVNKFDGQ